MRADAKARTADAASWHEAERRIRAELRRIDNITTDVRKSVKDLRWQGTGTGRFRWRTERRIRELSDKQDTYTNGAYKAHLDAARKPRAR
jgi:hypothetical protein